MQSELKLQYWEELNQLMKRRLEELEELKKLGINPYPYEFPVNSYSEEILRNFRDEDPPMNVSIAGRIMSIRRMGKATFSHIQDSKGKIQVYFKKDVLGDKYDILRLLDIGDIIGVKGEVFRTKTGEITVKVEDYQVLAKAIRPLPVVKEKIDEYGNKIVYDPFTDKEMRYRQRYVDLIVNPDVRQVFIKRAKIISTIREILDSYGFIEVETPILQPVYGGATARPFVTHHNALDMDLYLRIADELYLKRLIVGGFDGVYEIGKDFRNEGMDRMHNPEFTMLELYVAYKDYNWMMEFTENLIYNVNLRVNGTAKIKFGDNEIDLTPPWRRVSMFDLLKQYTGENLEGKSEDELRAVTKRLNVDVSSKIGVGKIIDEIFSEIVQPNLIQPTFVIDYPVEMSPLAKRHRNNPRIVERFEVIICGMEVCNAFSELNDPIDQRMRFEEQAKLRAQGDEEAMTIDEDFIRALEYGMPPTAGLGIGIDRLVMILTNQRTIRDVILFPHMRPEK